MKTEHIGKQVSGLIFRNLWFFLLILMFQTACKPKVGHEVFFEKDGNLWARKGIGGGGAMFSNAISPHDENVVVVACDMGGSYITYDGGESWRQFNLPGGVSQFEFDPVNEEVIYALSLGLYKSEDMGKTWGLVYPKLDDIDRMIAKGDHAANRFVMKDSSTIKVNAFSINTSNNKELLLALDKGKSEIDLIHSKNGGLEWKTLMSFENQIIKTDFVPNQSGLKEPIAFTSECIWKTNGEQEVLPESDIFANQYASGMESEGQKYHIFAISGNSYFQTENVKSEILHSSDLGNSWEFLQSKLLHAIHPALRQAEWRAIATSKHHPEVVYVSFANAQVKDTVFFGVAKSEDFGQSWETVWKDALGPQGYKISRNFFNDWLNERFGPMWGENPFFIGVAPKNPNIAYAGDFGRTVCTTDGGNNWKSVTSRKMENGWTSTGLDVTTSYNVCVDPFDSNHIFVPTTDIGLVESRDGGMTWLSATNERGVPDHWVNTTYWLTFDPLVKGRAWMVNSNIHDLPRPKMWRNQNPSNYMGGILRTNDSGEHWSVVSKDIGEAAFTHILLDLDSNPSKRILYACAFGKGVYKSENGGLDWLPINKGIARHHQFAWQIEKNYTSQRLFLIISRKNEKGNLDEAGNGAIYTSSDHGATWNLLDLPQGVTGPTSLLTFDNAPERLLLAAWGNEESGAKPDTGGGIFLSEDGGNTWTCTMEKDQHINALSMDLKSGILYACGFEGSAYFSKDAGNTWSRISGYNFKWGQRIVPDPYHKNFVYVNTFGGGVWYGDAFAARPNHEDLELKTYQKLYSERYQK